MSTFLPFSLFFPTVLVIYPSPVSFLSMFLSPIVFFLALSLPRVPFPSAGQTRGDEAARNVGLSHDCLFTVAMCPPNKPKCASFLRRILSYFPLSSRSGGVFLCSYALALAYLKLCGWYIRVLSTAFFFLSFLLVSFSFSILFFIIFLVLGRSYVPRS